MGVLVKCKLKCRMHKNTSINRHFYDRINVVRVVAPKYMEEIEFSYGLIRGPGTAIV